MKTNTLDFDAQALREKILDLAMRGKLVPQDPNDEPASVLLEKIKAEKEQLIKEKKIKKSKPLAPITDDEKPFDIPESWEWVRLGDLFDITSSKRVMKSEWKDTGIPFYRAREIVSIKNHRPLKDPIFIDKKTYEGKIKISGKPNINDILLTGVGTLGVPYIVDNDKKFYFKDGNIIWLKNLINLNPKFISYVVQSPYMLKKINNGRGTTVATLTIVRSNNLLIPLPPLEEQSRIAAKIAQLFALLRKVESSTQQYAKLQTLLKSKVLDLAMRGKLVGQDPHDEPAGVLLKKLKVLKESKKQPHTIPKTWKWIVLGSGVNFFNGRAYKKNELLTNSKLTPVLRVGNLFTNSSWFYSDLKLSADKYINSGDLIYAWSASFGPKIWNGGRVIYHYHIWKLDFNPIVINKNYLYYYLLDERNVIGETDLHGSTMKHITKTNMEHLSFPLPPLKEQSRIATKVAQLFALLHKVESTIQ
ncbi:restriction endonuclease subunit S [Lactobacillus crispatus]|uniref:restriction endonuclease subunit S n=1 Tax=Lactobacillus crispatus TaxID=47770 RepID=UPI001075FB55|nr:restriction endonuclease subunit S [Lactobacillus crispatus]MBH9540319.1 restriction endonuclease subunit S [Lactobacillus crispatus]MBI1719263.1 type I restriction-modification system [Lactobacillus crispatus]MCZ3560519.1 restriction endonuclease subunit S [Lactobacillus crispatus]MCZ3562298.1 restriction endonuclease subunit S [Lactobacillus crispatus]MCZ3564684.1 restriction endonuclease subunit S [Lactobacillus crispatus]